jgi:hypothetical protein
VSLVPVAATLGIGFIRMLMDAGVEMITIDLDVWRSSLAFEAMTL